MSTLFNNVRSTFTDRIAELTWMDDATKSRAIEKVCFRHHSHQLWSTIGFCYVNYFTAGKRYFCVVKFTSSYQQKVNNFCRKFRYGHVLQKYPFVRRYFNYLTYLKWCFFSDCMREILHNLSVTLCFRSTPLNWLLDSLTCTTTTRWWNRLIPMYVNKCVVESVKFC